MYLEQEPIRNDALKIVAVAVMIIDHIGAIFFPSEDLFRIIGRIAFPIFSYYLVQGAIYTSNIKKYAVRLFLFGLLSQIPFTLLFDTYTLNIMFVLLLSLLLIRGGWMYVGVVGVLTFLIPMDYDFYGVLIAPILYWLRDKKALALLVLAAITIFYCFYNMNWLQIYAIPGFIFVLFARRKTLNKRVNKYFFYWFYPAHMIVLLIVKYLFNY
ncbi:conjugal transfer protein TraX (plasmid) [Paenibacillus thiaminolyticus]|uniref:TraX family protein n=1 Tax=Paenibacillus thiaminolyticus TaxID=49283 RepID=UPI00232B73E6|nr:TraX family protein [Paenibacillus thiaminolyticus]WCF11454.1 conjugal transfer protein TraX [Paenibacillus thiaminolyticus]